VRLKSRFLIIPLALTLALAGACGDDDDDSQGGAIDSSTTTVVEPTGSVALFSAMEPNEGVALQKVVDDLINSKVKYKATVETSSAFEEQAKIRVQGGNPPEIIMYPQPGSVVEQAKAGKAIALEDLGFNMAELNATFGEFFMSMGEYNGKHYGMPTNINFKSMIWYPKDDFDKAGYKIPKTWDEMIALSNQMVANGQTPWCVGFESGTATGWPATDWMEDIMLRTAGVETYDKWVKHQIPFNDPAVVTAGQKFGEVLFGNKYVLGGAKQTPAIKFADAPLPMFENPPKCWLHRQANFISAQFPKAAKAGVDYDWFPFPSITQPGESVLFAGEMSAVFKDTPAVRDLLKRFSGKEVQCAQGADILTSRISPNVNVTSECYANTILAQAADVLQKAVKAGNARFDASDLMPSAVGSGTFWTGMVKYAKSGPGNLNSVLAEIEASWPKS
jgi:alpha-glucoside transport system substrate-binding protein